MTSTRTQVLEPLLQLVILLAVAGGLTMAGPPSAEAALAEELAGPAATAAIPAPAGYWRMEVPPSEFVVLNSATGLADAWPQGNVTLVSKPPDNNVGWLVEDGVKNRHTAEFDGDGDHFAVDANAAYDLGTEMTLAAWVKLADETPDQKVVGKLKLSGPATAATCWAYSTVR